MSTADTVPPLPLPDFDKPVKLLIVVGHAHSDVTGVGLAAAKTLLTEAGVAFDVVTVPGVLEIPTAIAIAERTSNFDGYVALGCVLRGQIGGAKAVRNSCYRGLSQLGQNGICIGNGIVEVKNRKQAKASGATSHSNNGAAAVNAALHLVALSRKWGRETKGIGFKPASSEFLMADNPENGPKTA